jgi:dihydrolipoamide dehydrogenase
VVGVDTELLIIGGGPGGYVAALRAAQLGMQVLLAEERELGGVCLNRGCIPSKALVDMAELAHRLPAETARGIHTGPAEVDLAQFQRWKEQMVARLRDGVTSLLANQHVRVVKGRARLTGRFTAEIETEGLTVPVSFRSCILATGSTATALPGLPFDGTWAISSTEALTLEAIPRRLVVVGGGYIGLELGIAYRKLGAAVTVVEVLDRILPGTDPELVQVLTRSLDRLGIEVALGARVLGRVETKAGPALRVEAGGTARDLPADKVLITVGRTPLSADLGLQAAGVATNGRGFIPVNASLQTSAPNIYAIGDLTGQPLLAHKATRQGLVAAEAASGQPVAMDVRVMPAVVFTDPEIGVAGLTEAEAVAQGYEVTVGRFPFAASGRALTREQGEGIVKLVADRKSGTLLGVHIAGPDAGTLIGEAGLALEMGATAEDLALTIHAHPTLPEALMEAAEAALGFPVHVSR